MPPKMAISPTMEELETRKVRAHPDEFEIANEMEALGAAKFLLCEKLGIVIRNMNYRIAEKMGPMCREVRKH